MNNKTASVLARLAAAPAGMLIAAIALAGCGHSSNSTALKSTSTAASNASSSAAPGTSSGSGTSSAAAPAYKPLSKSQLAALLPTKATLPGWTSSPSTNTPNDPETLKEDAEFAKCLGVVNTDKDHVAEASTPDFNLTSAGADQYISATADSFKTTAAVTSDVQTFKNPRYVPCFKQELAAHGATLFGDGLTYVSSTITLTPGSAANVAGRIDAALRLKDRAGKAVTVGMTEVALVGRGVEESLSFVAAGKPVAAAVAGPFIAEASTKLAHATSTTDA